MAGGREGSSRTTAGAFRAADVQDTERRDALDAAAMLDALRRRSLPLYYARNAGRLLRRVGAALQARDDDRDPALQYAPRGARLCAGAVLAGGGSSTDGSMPGGHAGGARARHMEAARAPGVGRGRICAAARGRRARAAAGRRAAAAGGGGAQRPRAALTCAWSSWRSGCCRRSRPGAAGAVLVPRRAPADGDWRALLATTDEHDSEGAAVYRAATPSRRTAASSPPRSASIPWHELLSHPLELGLLSAVDAAL